MKTYLGSDQFLSLCGVFLVLHLLVISCTKNPNPEEEKMVFWKFSRVDTWLENGAEQFKRADDPFSAEETDTLKAIFEESHIPYYISDNGQIWVSEIFVVSLGEMHSLYSKLKNRMAKEK